VTASNTSAFVDNARSPAVHGVLHSSASASGMALALTHGAGGNMNAPVLVAMANALADAGFAVLRYQLPYRQARPTGPPRPGDAERDREGIRTALQALRATGAQRIFAGGHSYGGRQTTMLAADDATLAEGLLLFSYPLHPPGRAAQMRTAHFPQLKVPAMFVHGEGDTFATTAELEAAIKLIPVRTAMVEVAGAGHDLRPPKRSQSLEELAARVAREFAAFVGG
jgi:uncharacterized protein